jgi:hypothetical protein
MLRRSMLLTLACAGAFALGMPAAAQAKACEPVKIQFQSNLPKLDLLVSATNIRCAKARRVAGKVAVTKGQFLPDGLNCSVQTGPTIGECWNYPSQRKRLSWRLKGS